MALISTNSTALHPIAANATGIIFDGIKHGIGRLALAMGTKAGVDWIGNKTSNKNDTLIGKAVRWPVTAVTMKVVDEITSQLPVQGALTEAYDCLKPTFQGFWTPIARTGFEYLTNSSSTALVEPSFFNSGSTFTEQTTRQCGTGKINELLTILEDSAPVAGEWVASTLSAGLTANEHLNHGISATISGIGSNGLSALSAAHSTCSSILTAGKDFIEGTVNALDKANRVLTAVSSETGYDKSTVAGAAFVGGFFALYGLGSLLFGRSQRQEQAQAQGQYLVINNGATPLPRVASSEELRFKFG